MWTQLGSNGVIKLSLAGSFFLYKVQYVDSSADPQKPFRSHAKFTKNDNGII